MGEIVGVFYNKDKVPEPPKTFGRVRGHARQGEGRRATSPISFGNLDKFGGIHEFQTVQNQFAPQGARRRDFVFAKQGPSFDTPENREAATKLQEWADKGYFTPELQRHRLRPCWQQFAKGKGPFTIAGTWITADLARRVGDKLGFFLMPGEEEGSEPVSLGGESLPWAITAKSKNADVAAAYIDFITNANAATCSSRPTTCRRCRPTSSRPASAVNKDVFAAWKALNDADGLTPYIDYATPTFYDDFSGAVQRLLAGKLSRTRSRRPSQEATTRSSPTRCDDARAAAASRGASPTCTCCRGCSSSGCSCWRRCCTARGCRCSPGTA